jgi:O-antigen/teichoic acid export membrane protein
VSLYISRIIIDALGIVDYGLNNIVAGIISLFSFLNGSLGAATSRFLTYELGLNNKERLKTVFCTSYSIHFGLAIIVIILCETVGLWIINHLLIIPEDRLLACNIIYQFVVITAFISMTQVPFNAIIIAHERMNVYAVIGIVEVLLKLGVALLLTVVSYDKLIIFGLFNAIIMTGVYIFYHLYCKYNFSEYTIDGQIDKPLFKEMLSFSGWSLFGSAVSMTRGQGINILMNIFFGPVVNAANAIASQVNSAITIFSSNFTMALNPQIVKTYARNEKEQMKNLIVRSGKFSFFLLMILSIPVFLETDVLLHLWLKEVPSYAGVLTKLVILFSMTDCFTSTMSMAVQATGKIKYYQIFVGGVLLLTFPIAYICYKLGADPTAALVVSIVISVIAISVRLIFVRKYLNIPKTEYIKNVLLTVLIVFVVSIIPPFVFHKYMEEGVLRLIIVALISVLSSAVFIYLLGLTVIERRQVNRILHKKIFSKLKF